MQQAKLSGWALQDDCFRLLQRGATEEYIVKRIIKVKGVNADNARTIVQGAKAFRENFDFATELTPEQKKLQVLGGETKEELRGYEGAYQ